MLQLSNLSATVLIRVSVNQVLSHSRPLQLSLQSQLLHQTIQVPLHPRLKKMPTQRTVMDPMIVETLTKPLTSMILPLLRSQSVTEGTEESAKLVLLHKRKRLPQRLLKLLPLLKMETSHPRKILMQVATLIRHLTSSTTDKPSSPSVMVETKESANQVPSLRKKKVQLRPPNPLLLHLKMVPKRMTHTPAATHIRLQTKTMTEKLNFQFATELTRVNVSLVPFLS